MRYLPIGVRGPGPPNQVKQCGMLRQRWFMRERLDQLAKVLAIAGVTLYLVGFAVVAFRDASYGFIAFNAVRARIITAGLLFAVFFIPAFFGGAQVYGRLGFTPQFNLKEELASGKRFFLLRTYRWSNLILKAWAFSYFFQFMLVQSSFRWSRFILFVAYPAIKSLPKAWNEPRFEKGPGLFVLTAFAVDFVAVALAVYLKWLEFLLLLAWFFVAGYEADEIGMLLDRKVELRQHPWHLSALSAFVLFSVFGLGIYPRLQPRIGGGHLSSISFQFANEARIDKSLEFGDLLVDEVDTGYYIVRSEDDHSAIFVPRAVVTLAFYGSDHPPFDQKNSAVPK